MQSFVTYPALVTVLEILHSTLLCVLLVLPVIAVWRVQCIASVAAFCFWMDETFKYFVCCTVGWSVLMLDLIGQTVGCGAAKFAPAVNQRSLGWGLSVFWKSDVVLFSLHVIGSPYKKGALFIRLIIYLFFFKKRKTLLPPAKDVGEGIVMMWCQNKRNLLHCNWFISYIDWTNSYRLKTMFVFIEKMH